MLNQTAISMNVVRLYSGRKQAMMLFRICGVKTTKSFPLEPEISAETQQQPVGRWCSRRREAEGGRNAKQNLIEVLNDDKMLHRKQTEEENEAKYTRETLTDRLAVWGDGGGGNTGKDARRQKEGDIG